MIVRIWEKFCDISKNKKLRKIIEILGPTISGEFLFFARRKGHRDHRDYNDCEQGLTSYMEHTDQTDHTDTPHKDFREHKESSVH